jgi:hypothetical protein
MCCVTKAFRSCKKNKIDVYGTPVEVFNGADFVVCPIFHGLTSGSGFPILKRQKNFYMGV